MIKISSFTIDNFFSFRNSRDFNELSSLNAFIGPNNVGKSNILWTLKWYRDLIEKDFSPLEIKKNRHRNSETGYSSFFIKFNL
jgi:AAA15 family ATPase/GTPase